MASTGDGVELQLKKLHPFFSAPSAASKTVDAVTPPTPDPSCSPASEESRSEPPEKYDEDGEHGQRRRKRRKTAPPARVSETVPRAPRTKRRTRVSAGPSIIQHFGKDSLKDRQQDGDEKTQNTLDGQVLEPLRDRISPLSVQASESLEGDCETRRDHEIQSTPQSTRGSKPQKILKFNPATGTIGSPPPSKPSTPAAASTSTSTSTSGRKRGRKPKALVITIPYGTDTISRQRIGQRINAILLQLSEVTTPLVSADAIPKTPPSNQELDSSKVSETTEQDKRTAQKMTTPKKPAHPFFQAKSKAAPSTDDDKPRARKDKSSANRQVVFTSTPCSPRQRRSAPSNLPLPPPGSKKAGPKIPGAQHPAWPWRDMVHVREGSSSAPTNNSKLQPTLISPKRRKAKGQAIHVAKHESILHATASKLGIAGLADDLKSTKGEDFHPVAPSIRVPTKHFEPGQKLQARVFKELRTLKGNNTLSKTHPVIRRMYDSIATSLSAFDMATCESVAWAQKYAPTSAQCVLQSGREAELLRDWLQTLKVQAVDTGSSDNSSRPKGTSAPKKKRKHKKLEGFVVSSDEEANEMDAISDDAPQWLLHGGRDTKKTVVRSGDNFDRGGKPSSRLTNAVLLSGPHGCGKSATVYAIAKELDFEVFEINAGARRSGRDLLERVGDMTRNHLVSHQQKDESRSDGAVDDEVVKDLKSGKQGMMTSFFKPKPAQPAKQSQVDQKPGAAAAVPASQEKKPSRDQRQSLILLEEVDVLYEEDKQFWATVISMIAQSKRPFIMTCNNESVVPLQSLKLHGIFRFSPPPTDLAVDILLLIAANEGHALGRHAIEALYESRGHDLRAAITELNYWCQIGVGDLRGGFDWFYPRWPKGSDVDENGQTIRVISQNTYHDGMGWLNRDLTPMESSFSSTALDLHQEAWDHWGADLSDHHEFDDYSCWVKTETERAPSREARLALLQSAERFADNISESDICGPFVTPLSNHITLDATVPDLHTKTLDDFTIGNKLIEVTPLSYYHSISLGVSTSIRLLAQSNLARSQPSPDLVCATKHFDEKRITGDIAHHLQKSARRESSPINRKDYSIAFDPIASSDKVLANGYLEPSVFDREMRPLCLDVAPYVRGIVAYDQRLYNERRARSNLLSEGGRPEKKRMRTTRAALSALEGGSRATTRGEKYFAADLNPYLVMRTGGRCWAGLADRDQDQVDACADDAGGARSGKLEVGVEVDVDDISGQSS
ncbi:hypothetical protein F5Y14DRAFT_165559 [Nemania sp. NC0429]|nr:hypothetical protein F5Y14DRAFT_165559 [Nemania sp. NC0429]